MKIDLHKQNLRLNIQLKKGLKIPNLISHKNFVQDIDDESYLIFLDLTKNGEISTQGYQHLNEGMDTIEYIEIEDNYAVQNFKNYYINRYGNDKKVSLKNVLVNLVMGNTQSITCDIEVESVLRLSKIN
ncbi:MAG: hypothetical protein V7655_09870 [Aequorivita antarctica]